MIGVVDQIQEFLNGLWQRRWHAVVISWVVCLAGWVGVATLPDEYEVSTRIYVDTTSLLRPLLQGIAVEPDVASEVRLIRQTLLSRRNIEEVIRLTDLDLGAKSREERENLIQLLDRKTQLRSVAREDNLFSIRFSDSEPERARDVVEAFTTVLVETNLGQGRTDADTAQRFLDEQIEFYRVQLETSEKALADFERKNGRFLPESSASVLSEFLDAQSSLRDAEARRDEMQRQLEGIDPYIEVSPGGSGFGAGPPTDSVLQIAQLEGVIENLLARYTENHPDVVVAKRRLKAMQEKMAKERANIGGPGPDGEAPSTLRESNPVYEQLKIELVKAESEIGALKQKFARLEAKWLEVKEKLDQAPLLEVEKKKLLRDYGVISDKYQQLLSRSQSGRIAIDRTVKADNVKFRIIDPPIVPTEPVGPNRELFLTVVLVFGLGVGVAVPSLLVISKETLQGVRALRASFSIPVFGSVQDMTVSGRRGKKFLEALGVLIVMGALFAIFALLILFEARFGLQTIAPVGGPIEAIGNFKQILVDVFAVLKSKF